MTWSFERRWSERGRRRRLEGGQRRQTPAGYYGIPPIHKSHWGWPISLYFFLGGISGASYVVAAISQALGAEAGRPIVRTGRYVSLVTLLPGAVLLIYDLGRPSRFYRMFRIVKMRSPMSLGSWGLGLFGGFATLLAASQAAQDGVFGRGRAADLVGRLDSRPLALLGTLPAFFVSGYTGVLLGGTAIPVWMRSALTLGPLFIFSSMASGVALIRLGLSFQRVEATASARLLRLERGAVAGELALLCATAVRLGSLRRFFLSSTTGRQTAAMMGAGLIVPLAIDALAHRQRSATLSRLAGLLVLTGGYLLRHVIVKAGNASADDPEATFELTRRP